MSERILKLLAEETALTTAASTRNGQKLFRIRNSHASSAFSVLVKAGSTTTGSISLYAGEVLYISKTAAETIESSDAGTSVRIVPIAFGD
jgi:hypothetical protein